MGEKNKQQTAKAKCTQPGLCKHFILYMNGDVAQQTRQRIDEHLAGCAHCAELVRLLALANEVERDDARRTSSTG